MKGLILGFTNLVGTGEVLDVCLGCSGVGGVCVCGCRTWIYLDITRFYEE